MPFVSINILSPLTDWIAKGLNHYSLTVRMSCQRDTIGLSTLGALAVLPDEFNCQEKDRDDDNPWPGHGQPDSTNHAAHTKQGFRCVGISMISSLTPSHKTTVRHTCSIARIAFETFQRKIWRAELRRLGQLPSYIDAELFNYWTI